MRESRFWALMEDEFGKAYAHVLADQLVITPFQLTAKEALGAGVSTREVWRQSVSSRTFRKSAGSVGTSRPSHSRTGR